jgi:hypothetical protein
VETPVLTALCRYFWRQTYDSTASQTYSKLRLICTDEAPQNPDEMILQCSNPECGKWLHVKCIAEDAVAKAGEGDGSSKPRKKSSSPTKKRKSKTDDPQIGPSSKAQAKASMGAITAEVIVAGVPDGPDEEPAEKTEIIITDENGEQKSEPVACLFCKQTIE